MNGRWMHRYIPNGFLVLVLAATGCETLNGSSRSMGGATPEAVERQYLRQDVDRLKALAEESRENRRILDLRMERFSQDQVTHHRTVQEQLSALQREIQALQSDREHLRRQLADDISRRLEQKLGAPPSARSPASAAGQRTQTGYEHVVAAGQTLSEIAAAYGVSIHAILQANNLKDPNRLSLGQKLFIPE